jgi:hypothetical protein
MAALVQLTKNILALPPARGRGLEPSPRAWEEQQRIGISPMTAENHPRARGKNSSGNSLWVSPEESVDRLKVYSRPE